MSSRKRGSGTSASASHKQPKRQDKNETFLKWQRAHEKEHQSMAWLRADMDTQEITKPAILLTTPPVSSTNLL